MLRVFEADRADVSNFSTLYLFVDLFYLPLISNQVVVCLYTRYRLIGRKEKYRKEEEAYREATDGISFGLY